VDDVPKWDFSELEEIWARRRARLARVLPRIDRTGATRPHRSAEEQEWLEQRGELPPTREVDTPLGERGSTPRPRRPS
jgi:hypothetical protein